MKFTLCVSFLCLSLYDGSPVIITTAEGNAKSFTLFPLFFKGLARPTESTMEEEPHIGRIIKAELARQGRSIAWLAQQMGYTRQNMYHLLSRKFIYTDLLLKISEILHCDFFHHYTDYLAHRRKLSKDI